MLSIPWLAASLALQASVSSSFSPVLVSLGANPKTASSSFHTSSSHITPRRNLSTSNNEESSSDESLSFNMNGLSKRMQRQENQYAKLLMEQSKYAEDENEKSVPESVHIILFHPDTPKQHVHTVEFPQNSGNNLIMAFESGGDCANFARMLQDLEFADPCVSTQFLISSLHWCELHRFSLYFLHKQYLFLCNDSL